MNVQQLAGDVTKGKMPQTAGGRLNIKKLSYQYRDPSHDRLIFNMGIPIPGKDSLYIETGPWKLSFSSRRERNMIFCNISHQNNLFLKLKAENECNLMFFFIENSTAKFMKQ